ncbi:universal stress protein [Actinomycetospora cinnamomea]|uniref:Universal stress protein family protein n=1 Tax=Actinomycetospora cinnamomea TaxID=663609 RepID=A0A2U1F432_9PSEU|nr:universal stress protein [Actinomycetospora cinnamomea]PVZ06931.1 universal stress protein family protein [Actinomycetospora cinnamomea]
MKGGPVVIGVSIEGHDEGAVRWAAAEARALGVHLRLVHGVVVPRGGFPGQSMIGVDPRQGLLALGRRELQAMREEALRTVPDLPVEDEVVESEPVALLRAHAPTSSLIVVGSDGFGSFGERVLRGIARGLAGHVGVPVVVVPRHCDAEVRDRAGGRAPVVVGDDGTAGARGAVRFAARRAADRRAPLVIVRAGPDARLLPEEAPSLGTDRPPAVHVVVAEERADRVLADQARDAELVVLGVGEHGVLHARHRTRPDLVRKATCPVVIAPPDLPVEAPTERARAGAAGQGA